MSLTDANNLQEFMNYIGSINGKLSRITSGGLTVKFQNNDTSAELEFQ